MILQSLGKRGVTFKICTVLMADLEKKIIKLICNQCEWVLPFYLKSFICVVLAGRRLIELGHYFLTDEMIGCDGCCRS